MVHEEPNWWERLNQYTTKEKFDFVEKILENLTVNNIKVENIDQLKILYKSIKEDHNQLKYVTTRDAT